MASWARQSSADGNYALAAKCWLAMGKGEEAAELLARLGDRESLRVAALLMSKTGWKGEFYCIAGSVIQTVCMKLLEDNKDMLGWNFVMYLVEKMLHRLLVESRCRCKLS